MRHLPEACTASFVLFILPQSGYFSMTQPLGSFLLFHFIPFLILSCYLGQVITALFTQQTLTIRLLSGFLITLSAIGLVYIGFLNISFLWFPLVALYAAFRTGRRLRMSLGVW